LASQVRRYVKAFNLNMITSAQIHSTEYDPAAERWTVRFQTPTGQRTAFSKHVVMATGIGSQKMNIPLIADRHLYKGTSIHSAQFKNAEQLKVKGVKVSETSIEEKDRQDGCLCAFHSSP
jgi:cation diffusion facilitator CzcD-associated flavoprotein CzcO